VRRLLDFKFDWCKEVETGIEIIDTQNKELFRIGRDIEQLLICHCIGVKNSQLLDICMDLRNYVAYHFYQEEVMMKECNYNNYEAHKSTHDEITDYVIHIDCKLLSKEPYKVLSVLKTYVQEWIFNHILTEDIALCKCYTDFKNSTVSKVN
jgi:hemerythrin